MVKITSPTTEEFISSSVQLPLKVCVPVARNCRAANTRPDKTRRIEAQIMMCAAKQNCLGVVVRGNVKFIMFG
jgi:hypothetical protein